MKKETSSKPFILVDGSSYLFRAYFALPPLTNSHGEATGAMYGVLNMLRRLIKDYEPEYMAVVFDPKGKTFRHELYSEYKANRTVMPDELKAQIAPLHTMIKALGLPLVIQEGFEADDVIGTLAKEAEREGLSVVISTGDKDLAQLVNPNITLINTMTNTRLDEKGVEEKFGVKPTQIIDYLTLVGDTSDNVPGVPKVGPKTAVKWINHYGSLDQVIEKADEISGKVGENLRNFLKDLSLSRQLVTIKQDVPLQASVAALKLGYADKTKLIELFSHYEFKNWLAELLNQTEKTPTNITYKTLFTKPELRKVISAIQQKGQFAFDTETTSLDAMNAALVGVSLAVNSGEGFYIPLQHDYLGAPLQLSKADVLTELAPIFNDRKLIFIGQNIKYDMHILLNEGVEIKNQLQDTMIESYVLNSTSNRHDLDSLALNYLNRTTLKFEDVAGKGAKQKTFNEIEVEKATEYAAEDAEVTLALHEKLNSLLEATPPLKKVFLEIDMPLVPVLTRMERYGVLIDAAKLNEQSKFLSKRIAELEKEAFYLAGEEFNLGSPKQLQEILFNRLNLPIIKKTPQGQASTAEQVLQELALNYPLPKVILEYRTLSKLKSTYTDKLPEQIDPTTKRIHTSYNQAVTSTGRLSSNNPNLQNIPIRTEEGRKIRKAFIAPHGYRLITADYSQIELRIIAHVSKDPGLLKAFCEGLDVHRATAAEVFGVPLNAVTDEQRRHAKTINFGLLYGMSAFGLSKSLGIPRSDAQKYMDIYFERYPNIHQYMKDTVSFAGKHGFVETVYGRRIYVPDINSKNAIQKKAAERAAINAPMQGSAADIIKIAMLCVDQWIQTSGLPVKMIMQVHDELILEAKEEIVPEAVAHLRQCMEGALQLSVPFLVHVGVGTNWDEAH